ncbi:MAG: uroporphyrinogen-III C-methyltransferase [Proteobacteria bacterium]|nr:uroporphyrinogen-III C-methyltransferase [Pseudomonadota bacterium]
MIGAGPGDAELLTLKAVRALAHADVALVDDLVDDAVLAWLKPGARVVRVGKRGGCVSTPQRFIEAQMIALARDGFCVARVKGGDPFVFGRGGEERDALLRAGVDVEVVPGVTAGTGVPAALGIPVTHRDDASGVTFITGHRRDGALHDWPALVRSGTTLVVYMGVAALDAIVRALLDAGMDASMPVAVIQDGTLPRMRATVATLATVQASVRAAGLGSPALVVVGDVVRHAQLPALAATARRVA